jgi:hypothetical protein
LEKKDEYTLWRLGRTLSIRKLKVCTRVDVWTYECDSYVVVEKCKTSIGNRR